MIRRIIMATLAVATIFTATLAIHAQQQGRWKIEGDQCVFDPNDEGFDQCSPNSGRWKVEGDACVFDPNDSGPNQCPPAQPTEPGPAL